MIRWSGTLDLHGTSSPSNKRERLQLSWEAGRRGTQILGSSVDKTGRMEIWRWMGGGRELRVRDDLNAPSSLIEMHVNEVISNVRLQKNLHYLVCNQQAAAT